MHYFAFIALCLNGDYFIGYTDEKPKLDKISKTKKFNLKNKPIKIIWDKSFNNENEAENKEQEIKGWDRKQQENLVYGIWN